MSTPIQKLKRLQAMRQGAFGEKRGDGMGGISDVPADKIVIVMNKWNIFFR